MELVNFDNTIVLEHTENEKIHKLVKLESLNKYSKLDLFDKLNAICEEYNTSKENLIIATEEYNMILDKDLVSLGKLLMNEGYTVSLIPISENHLISKYGEYCLEKAEETGNYNYWIYNEFAEFLNEESFDAEKHFLKYVDEFGVNNLTLDEVEIGFGGDHSKIIDFILKKIPLSKYAKDKIDAWKKEGMSDRDILAHATQLQSEKFFQPKPFKQGNMFDPGFIKGLNNQHAKYNKAYKFVNDPAKMLNDKSSREDEKAFNMAKSHTQKRLHVLSKNLDKLDIVGVNDSNVDDVKKRIESLNKLVEKEQFPKTWLAKKIAWLRSLYRNLMYKLTLQKSSNPITNTLKKLAGIILRTIDKLALKLQNAVN